MAGEVPVGNGRLPNLATGLPLEFGGTGDQWSPETLLTAAVADCFVLTFRAIAEASKLEWSSLRCRVVGVLDRRDALPQFVEFVIQAKLAVPATGNAARAERLLGKAEASCLVTKSLKAPVRLEMSIQEAK